MRPGTKKIIAFLFVFGSAWLGIRFFLPLAAPFLLGTGLALMAEPGVRWLNQKVRMPRAAAAGICVTAALLALLAVLLLLGGLLLRQLTAAAEVLPDMELTAENSLHTLENGLLKLADHSPKNMQSMLKANVSDLFSGGSALLDKAVQYILSAAGAILTHIPGSALGFGTGIIAAYLISIRLPAIRKAVLRRLSHQQIARILSTLQALKDTLILWLGAQVKLAAISFGIISVGLLLLRISHAIVWAVIIAAVDFLPVFGSGTVLVPWSIVCLLQGDTARAAGLAGIYAAAALTRSALEPKLVGAQLGLDPLVTLISLYAGFRLWGVGGMLLLPFLTVSATRLLPEGK